MWACIWFKQLTLCISWWGNFYEQNIMIKPVSVLMFMWCVCFHLLKQLLPRGSGLGFWIFHTVLHRIWGNYPSVSQSNAITHVFYDFCTDVMLCASFWLSIHPLTQPTSMRAIRARYDPYLQTRHRVEQVSHLHCAYKQHFWHCTVKILRDHELLNGFDFTVYICKVDDSLSFSTH